MYEFKKGELDALLSSRDPNDQEMVSFTLQLEQQLLRLFCRIQ